MRLLTSGFAISPSRPQTPRGDGGGGGGGGGFALPLSLPPNRDKVVNVSPRGQGQAQRGVVGYAAVQVWLLQDLRISDTIPLVSWSACSSKASAHPSATAISGVSVEKVPQMITG